MPPIDTLRAAKRLQEENTFSAEQAERLAEILSDLDVASATKEDLDETEERLGQRIDDVESRLGERIDEVEERLGQRIDEVEERLGQRIDQVEQRLDQRIENVDERVDEVESRLTQRIELSEERLSKQMSEFRSDLYRLMLVGLGGLAAFLTVLNYVLG